MEPEYGIDDLARAAGMTVRTVRVYHEQGLLPPPQKRGRVGYYSPQHLDRLQVITQLLERGITHNGIRNLLDAWDRGEELADLLAPAGATATRPRSFPVQTISAAEIETIFADVPKGMTTAIDLGLYERLDEATYRILDVRLHHLGAQLIRAGVPLSAALNELKRIKADSQRIARRQVELLDQFVEPTAANLTLAARASAEVLSQTFQEHVAEPRVEPAG